MFEMFEFFEDNYLYALPRWIILLSVFSACWVCACVRSDVGRWRWKRAIFVLHFLLAQAHLLIIYTSFRHYERLAASVFYRDDDGSIYLAVTHDSRNALVAYSLLGVSLLMLNGFAFFLSARNEPPREEG